MRVVVLFIALMIGVAAPVRAADDKADAQAIILSQIDAFGRDDAAAAYSYASPLLHELFPQAEMFMGMVKSGYDPVYRHKSFQLGEFSTADGRMTQRANIIDANGAAWEAVYSLERQDDGTLKISGCSLVKMDMPA